MKVTSGGEANPHLFACFYAQAKMLKTTVALLAPPELRPMCVLDTDGGVALRLKLLGMTNEEREKAGIPHEPVYDLAGPWIKEDIKIYTPEATSAKGNKGAYAEQYDFFKNEAPKYKLAVWDSLTASAEAFLDEIKNTTYGAQKSRVTVGQGESATVHPTQSDYGMTHNRMWELIKMFDSGPHHAVMISHEKTGQIGTGESMVPKRVIAGPRTVGNAQIEMIPSIVDVVLRFENQSRRGSDGKLVNEIKVRTRNHGFFIAGDRSGVFEDEMVLDPSEVWGRLIHLIEMGKQPEGEQG